MQAPQIARIEALRKEIDTLFSQKYYDFMNRVFINKPIMSYQSSMQDYLYILSSSVNITLAFISQHPEIPWDYKGLSNNPNLTIDYINAHPEIPWCWMNISYNDGISIKTVVENADKPWDWDMISGRQYLTKKMIDEEYIGMPWNWVFIAYNKSIPIEFIQKHITTQAEREEIERAIQIRNKIPELVNIEPQYTMEDIETNPTINWHVSEIRRNKFTRDRKVLELKQFRRHLAAFKIQQMYRQARYNPVYAYCRKLVHAFYDENLAIKPV
jgi:hypothetical protein